MTIDGNKIVADEGKYLRRISDGKVMGWIMYLGYTHYLGGKKLDTPLLELPQHYEEVDMPQMTDEEYSLYLMAREEYKMEEEMKKTLID